MAASLKDVAALAGVSMMTVSNVVNGHRHVAPATRERVERAIAELHYRPNSAARMVRSGRSDVIALALPELHNAYFGQLAHLVVEQAAQHGLTVLIDETNGRRERELSVISGFRTTLIDGLILTPRSLTAEDLAEQHVAMPLVVLGERISGGGIDGVSISSFDAALAACRHLVAIGKRRIAAIGVPHTGNEEVAGLRLEGYRAALDEADLSPDPALLGAAASFTEQCGLDAMNALLDADAPPDGVFCFNDRLALGACRALLLRGLRVPEEVAVIGIDDVEAGRFATPTLSTIAPDSATIARSAVDMLVARMRGTERDRPATQVTAGFRLLPRESTIGRTPVAG